MAFVILTLVHVLALVVIVGLSANTILAGIVQDIATPKLVLATARVVCMEKIVTARGPVHVILVERPPLRTPHRLAY